jgi:hypothetical protein
MPEQALPSTQCVGSRIIMSELLKVAFLFVAQVILGIYGLVIYRSGWYVLKLLVVKDPDDYPALCWIIGIVIWIALPVWWLSR